MHLDSLGRVDDLSFFAYLSPFCFLSIGVIVLFPYLIKYYHILCIIIVFRLGSDKLGSCVVYCISQGISLGRWMIFYIRLFTPILFFVN